MYRKNNIEEFINIDSSTSKSVLKCITENKKIDFKNLKLENFKIDINKIKNEYKRLKSKNYTINNTYKYFLFWEMVKKRYKIESLILKKRNQKKKEFKVNIIFSDIGKALGFQPSLLFLLLYHKKMKKIIEANKIFEKLKNEVGIEEINNLQRSHLINSFLKKKISLITPLCPDYEHIKIAANFYKYTFNKLGEDIGLIGKKLIQVIDKLHKIFNDYEIEYKHYLHYGDFESYSQNICNRLKIDEKEFLKRLRKSVIQMNKKTNNKCIVSMVVKELSNKKDWKKRCLSNEKKIHNYLKKDLKFKRNIELISNSRASLYASWFPKFTKKDYVNIVIKQGAEYTTMGDLYFRKYSNPIILGFDHPKMKPFYNLNNDLPIIYGKTMY
jgi:hypothetical protein